MNFIYICFGKPFFRKKGGLHCVHLLTVIMIIFPLCLLIQFKKKTKEIPTINKPKCTLLSTTKAVENVTISRIIKCKNPVPSGFIRETTKGGLGNLMFSYASAYGIAAHLNSTLVTTKSHPLHKYFTLDTTSVPECIYRKSIVKNCKQHCSFDGNLFNLRKGKNYKVGLYLQSWKYFETVVKEIKKQFTFKPEISKKAEKIITNLTNNYLKKKNGDSIKIKSEELTFVGIHVRRGDFVKLKPNINFGYTVAPKQYIEKAMDYFTRNFSNVLFVVCSDDMTWSKDNIKGPNVAFVRGNSREVDMSVLIHCNHTIMTVGTFGWWAGFLTGGTTVYYKHPAKEGSKLRKHFSKDFSDFFYPRWIGME